MSCQYIKITVQQSVHTVDRLLYCIWINIFRIRFGYNIQSALHMKLQLYLPVGTALMQFPMQTLSSGQDSGLFFVLWLLSWPWQKYWKGKCKFGSLLTPQRLHRVTWHFVWLFPMQQWQKQDGWRKDAWWGKHATITSEPWDLVFVMSYCKVIKLFL